jgi:hypothetical protein
VKPRSVIFVVLGVLFVPFVYGSSSILDACAAIPDDRFGTSSYCSGGVKSREGKTCCWREQVPGKLLGDTYCQTCYEKTDSKGNSYLQCTEKTKQALKLPTEQSGPAGTVLEEQTTTTTPPILEAQRANVTILPSGIIQEANTSSNDTISAILGMEQSDLMSDNEENETGIANDGEEQEESGPSKGHAREGTDDADDQENIDEELPLE